jgi:hypothetical protein
VLARAGPLVQLQKFSAEQAMNRGLDIANGLLKESTAAGVHRLDVVSLCTFPTSEQKEGIHPESEDRCRLTFSFSRSLFRPRASEGSFLATSQTALFMRVLRLEDRE